MMCPTWSRTVQVPVVLTLVELASDANPLDIPCPGCGRSMGVHQPDEESPDHLIGTCDCGQHWAAIELISEGRAMLIALPAPHLLVALVPVEV